MATKLMPYRDLNHALKLLRLQIIEGIPYAQSNCPQFKTPLDAFNWLKMRTKYKNDPNNTELFQTLPTLLEDNFHGITGHGDCDCFTIAILTILAANNFNNIGIVLVGRNRFTPVHIYAYYKDEKGEKHFLDLTNKYYNQTRRYTYFQEIPFNLTDKEKQKMNLQLAENGLSRRRQTPKAVERYRRDAMDFKRKQQQGLVKRLNPYHVYLPSKRLQFREDYFDNLSNGEFQTMLLSEGYELEEIAELSGKRAERRREKKETKTAQKSEKKAAKIDKTRSKADAKRTRADAKRIKAERKANRDPNEPSAFDKIIGGANKVVGVYKNVRGENQPEQDEERATPQEAEEFKNRYGKDPKTKDEPKMVKIFGKEMSQTTAILGGLGIAAVIGGGIYLATKKGKKAA